MRIANRAEQLQQTKILTDIAVIGIEAHFTEVRAWLIASNKLMGTDFTKSTQRDNQLKPK